MQTMARIYILEPEADVRELLVRVADRLGHEGRELEAAAIPEVSEGDVLVVEPSDPPSLASALAVHERVPNVRIICVSVYSSLPEAAELAPFAYVVKPFRLEELERALREAAER
jgi:DNA-binding NtrC family response regulator